MIRIKNWNNIFWHIFRPLRLLECNATSLAQLDLSSLFRRTSASLSCGKRTIMEGLFFRSFQRLSSCLDTSWPIQGHSQTCPKVSGLFWVIVPLESHLCLSQRSWLLLCFLRNVICSSGHASWCLLLLKKTKTTQHDVATTVLHHRDRIGRVPGFFQN